jgi:hypothetical protein
VFDSHTKSFLEMAARGDPAVEADTVVGGFLYVRVIGASDVHHSVLALAWSTVSTNNA